MEANVKAKYEEWLNSDFLSKEDRDDLVKIENNEKEITERFYKDLDFGTGGLRGIRGVGTNRMNVYVVRKATQGLANYMLKTDKDAKSKGIVIAYDSRIQSEEFAETAALVMAGNGIKAYLFNSLRSTPELSFAVRELKTLSGIVVTASHNPPEYNGYKVYWDDGAQVVAPHDKKIIEEVYSIQNFNEIKYISKEAALEKGLLEIIGKEQDDKFIEQLKKQVIVNNDLISKMGKTMKIVYTPLHGAGNVACQRILKEVGFENVYVVKEQEKPDGNFPTASYPNPEDPKVFSLGIKLATEKGAKIVMANDPDADRIGIAIQKKDGEWMFPNGNQVGVLAVDYILKNMKNKVNNGAIISTVVSTPMLDNVCEKNGVSLIRTLTGFKFIGEKIKGFEEKKDDKTYLFGFEESYGYLKGTHARDKDAIGATLLIAEIASYYEDKGISIDEAIESLYNEYGHYRDGIESLTMQGKEGAEKIASIMSTMRENTPKEVTGKKVVIVRDFLKSVEKNKQTGVEIKINMPSSNVLQLVLEDNTYITARPSGTEPKIKFYFGVNSTDKKSADEKLVSTMEEFLKNIK
ncbi:MAG: phospho-sugar mutase [Fusobacteria bacterium]|nr:phospho-sugar mutase [Fusobacteriota bacterium]